MLLEFPVIGPTSARAGQAVTQVAAIANELLTVSVVHRKIVRDLVRQDPEVQLQRVNLTTIVVLRAARSESGCLKDEVVNLRSPPRWPGNQCSSRCVQSADVQGAVREGLKYFAQGDRSQFGQEGGQEQRERRRDRS